MLIFCVPENLCITTLGYKRAGTGREAGTNDLRKLWVICAAQEKHAS